MKTSDEDALWLRSYRYLASDAEVEAFCERVAIRVADGMTERAARVLTLAEIKRNERIFEQRKET